MGILKFAINASYKHFYENLGKISKEQHKSRFLMLCDSAVCMVLFGSGLSDYLNYEFYKRSFKEKSRYVTIRTQDSFYKKVSPPAYKKIFTVKPNFMKAFSQYTKRKYLLPEESDEEALKAFLNENAVFMQKPVDGLGGHGVKKVCSADITDTHEYLNYLKDNRLFIEQYVIQHEKMSALCQRSVNTIRIMTSSVTGTPEIIFTGLRVGNGKCDVDNFHGGGMGVLINKENGILIGEAIDKDLNHFQCHPVSGIKFDGYEIPYWNEIKQMVCEAALIEPRIMVIGWDVAVTPDGPIFIEANRRPGFDLPQVLYDRGLKDIVKNALDGLKHRKDS